MAIQYPIDWWNVGRLTALSMAQENAIAITESPYTGVKQAQTYPKARFSFVADVVLETKEEITAMNAWLGQLRGQLGTFNINWCDLALCRDADQQINLYTAPALPRGTDTLTGVIAGTDSITEWQGYPFLWSPVDQIPITAIATKITWADNLADITFFPPTRRNTPAGTGIILQLSQDTPPEQANLTCRMAGNVLPIPIRPPFRAQVRLEFAEVIE